MTAGWFLTYHEIPELVKDWLARLGIRDPDRGARDLADLTRRAGEHFLPDVARLAVTLHMILPRCADPGMALANLDRYLAALPAPGETVRDLADDPRLAEILLQVFSSSHYFTEVLVRDPGLLGWLRAGPERPSREALAENLWSVLNALSAEHEQSLALRRFRQRESLRIGYNDIVRGLPLEFITQDLSDLADACVEGAVRLARIRAESRFGTPRTRDQSRSRFVVLALGKLGGEELNYSSDIDLVFLYDADGETTGPRVVSNAEFFAHG